MAQAILLKTTSLNLQVWVIDIGAVIKREKKLQ
jgi:hypothetical protein